MASTLPELRATSTLARPVSWKSQVFLALLTALLLDLCFPLAGPMPPWQGAIAWIALVPLLFAVLRAPAASHPRSLRNSAATGYLCGIAWYVLNSYWIYQTMHVYGGVPPLGAAGILLLYSLVLGLYFGLFAWGLALCHRRLGLLPALCLAPLLWPAIELLAYHVTRVPWDQLGYAQVDNFWLTRLAPYTGTYGIAAVLMTGNVLFAAALLRISATLTEQMPRNLRPGIKLAAVALLFCAVLQVGDLRQPAPAPTSATALLLQVNLGTQNVPRSPGDLWADDISRFSKASERNCWPWFPGIPGLVHHEIQPDCATLSTEPDLIAWPEAPSPFRDEDPRFRADIGQLARTEHSAVVVGDVATDYFVRDGRSQYAVYNSASFFSPQGRYVGRYDKIHLVPFGEYVPFARLFSWANALTEQIGTFTHGWRRVVFPANGHTYGTFICYESVFSDEVRLFAKEGAQVFVNISDDGWYGDTSAPWQHLNMARMRAIENHRWLLLDTNDGLTSAIDPQGRVTQAVPRHLFTALTARYGFESDRTFYTLHGDVFAYLCGLLSIAVLACAAFRRNAA